MIVRPPLCGNNASQRKFNRLCFLLGISATVLLHVSSALGQTGSVTLAWNPSSNSAVAGYRLYYGVASGIYTNLVDAGKSTNATISGLTSGVNYFFAATDYTTSGLESPFSSEVSYTPPVATAPSIALSSPANGAVYAAPANVSLAASVVTNGHTINKVQFFNGATLLGEDALPPYGFVWTNVAAGTYSLTAKVLFDASSTGTSATSTITVNPQTLASLAFASTSGAITSPFIASNGIVYQPLETGVTNGGRAAYNVTIPASGNYLVSAMVLAPNSGMNSFYVNFDSEPTDPTMIWDVPITTSLASNVVSWRGTGTDTNDQFMPKVFTLAQGTHQLIIRGREANTQLGAITLLPQTNSTPPLTNSAPPVIAFASPASGSTYQAPASLSLTAAVTPNGHTITKVQLFSGSTLLVEDTSSPYSFTWANVPAGSYTLTATAVYDAGATVTSSPVNVSVASPLFSTTFASTSGSISSPFTAANGVVWQSIQTGVTNGGRAAYSFTVSASGDYLITGDVNAPSSTANSFYVNIDAEPTDPLMIWDIPVTAGFTFQAVSWRGNGTSSLPQFAPKVFNLTQGAHQLIIRGLDAYAQLGALTLSAAVALPSPWQVLDIGGVGATGNASVTGSVYTVSGAGALGGSADSFRFLYQPMTGDGEIRAQIASQQNTSAGARAGIMIRETLTPGSRYAFVGISPGGTVLTQARRSTSAGSVAAAVGSGVLPNIWVRLVRSNNKFYSYLSADGANWTQVDSTPITMASSSWFGFAVASGQAGALSAATFSAATAVP